MLTYGEDLSFHRLNTKVKLMALIACKVPTKCSSKVASLIGLDKDGKARAMPVGSNFSVQNTVFDTSLSPTPKLALLPCLPASHRYFDIDACILFCLMSF